MTPLSNITGKQMRKFVESLGYSFSRQRGSHIRFHHDLKKSITIPASGKRTIKPGIIKGLLNTMQIDVCLFYRYLNYNN